MRLLAPLPATAALAFLAAPVAAQTSPVPVSALHSYMTADDYPIEAIRNGEQGTVAFRLQVGADGAVSACSITQSSGSATLDATSCRIMTERARFTPARNAQGDPVAGTFDSRIRWSMPGGGSSRGNLPPGTVAMPSQVNAALEGWYRCAQREAAAPNRSTATPRLAADEILARCAEAESAARAALATVRANNFDPEVGFTSFREMIRARIVASVQERRRPAQ
jgi:TonB family protein